jgi:hypothetical protein
LPLDRLTKIISWNFEVKIGKPVELKPSILKTLNTQRPTFKNFESL